MQPSETDVTLPEDFNFLLKQDQQTQAPSGKFSKLGKPVKILLAAILILIIVIFAGLIFGGSNTNSEQIIDLAAQNQEIVRVSQDQESKFTDQETIDLSATTQVVLNSQKTQLLGYLSKVNVKYNDKQLTIKKNSETDKQLQTAAQDNNLDNAYISYLKTALINYLNSINEAFNSAGSPDEKSILQSANKDIQTLLKSPQFNR